MSEWHAHQKAPAAGERDDPPRLRSDSRMRRDEGPILRWSHLTTSRYWMSGATSQGLFGGGIGESGGILTQAFLASFRAFSGMRGG